MESNVRDLYYSCYDGILYKQKVIKNNNDKDCLGKHGTLDIIKI